MNAELYMATVIKLCLIMNVAAQNSKQQALGIYIQDQDQLDLPVNHYAESWVMDML